MGELHDILAEQAIINDVDWIMFESKIKILMLEVFIRALKAGSVAEMGDMFRKEVSEL